MSSVRVCEVCGKKHESNLVIQCVECLRTKNDIKIKTERLFRDLAAANGWEATKKGYPDFMCYRGNEFSFVEIKKNFNTGPTTEQARFINRMLKFGVPCKVWRPSDGFILT